MTSFAGIASYVSEIHSISDVVSQGAQGVPGLYRDLATNTTTLENCCIVISVLGAMILCVSGFSHTTSCSLVLCISDERTLTGSNSTISLGMFMMLIAYVVQRADKPTQATTDKVSYSPQDPEQAARQPQVLYLFAGVQEIKLKP